MSAHTAVDRQPKHLNLPNISLRKHMQVASAGWIMDGAVPLRLRNPLTNV